MKARAQWASLEHLPCWLVLRLGSCPHVLYCTVLCCAVLYSRAGTGQRCTLGAPLSAPAAACAPDAQVLQPLNECPHHSAQYAATHSSSSSKQCWSVSGGDSTSERMSASLNTVGCKVPAANNSNNTPQQQQQKNTLFSGASETPPERMRLGN
jgi:hypothetical protein